MTPVDRDPSSGLNGAVAAVLRAERAASQRLTQDELAEAAGMPVVSLRRYLNGKRDINVAVLDAICQAMELDPKWVVAQAAERLAKQRADISFAGPAVGSGGVVIAAHLDPNAPARNVPDLKDPAAVEAWLNGDDNDDALRPAARKTGRRGSNSEQDDD